MDNSQGSIRTSIETDLDLGNLSSGYLDRPMYANHTISLEYTLLRRGLFFNSEVSGFQYVRENRAEELN